jgi:hypothetical protein
MSRAFAIVVLWVAPAWAAPSAREVMVRNEEARRISTMESGATLTTQAKGKEPKVKKFSWWRKLGPDGVHFKTLTRFHAPAEVRGEGILFLEGSDGENDIQMYLPAFKKIRRVETQQQSGSFMGSEFSYSDIATPHVDDHQYKMVKEETCPTPEAASLKCWVIESTPANEKVLDRTGYSRSVSWIRHDNAMAVQVEYSNREGEPWKKLVATKIQEVDKARHQWLAHHLRIENVKSGRSTELEFADVKANGAIADSVFTTQNLSRAQ